MAGGPVTIEELDKLFRDVPSPANDRLVRLWVVACGRLVLQRMQSADQPSVEQNWYSSHHAYGWEKALIAAEMYADNEINRRSLREVQGEIYSSPCGLIETSLAFAWPRFGQYQSADRLSNVHAMLTSFCQQCGVLTTQDMFCVAQDLFGIGGQQTIGFRREWRSEAAVGIASQMYESRDFGNMPILADALEDAGCVHADILAHCRDPHGVHVRGCWVVDLVLGKA